MFGEMFENLRIKIFSEMKLENLENLRLKILCGTFEILRLKMFIETFENLRLKMFSETFENLRLKMFSEMGTRCWHLCQCHHTVFGLGLACQGQRP